VWGNKKKLKGEQSNCVHRVGGERSRDPEETTGGRRTKNAKIRDQCMTQKKGRSEKNIKKKERERRGVRSRLTEEESFKIDGKKEKGWG